MGQNFFSKKKLHTGPLMQVKITTTYHFFLILKRIKDKKIKVIIMPCRGIINHTENSPSHDRVSSLHLVLENSSKKPE